MYFLLTLHKRVFVFVDFIGMITFLMNFFCFDIALTNTARTNVNLTILHPVHALWTNLQVREQKATSLRRLFFFFIQFDSHKSVYQIRTSVSCSLYNTVGAHT